MTFKLMVSERCVFKVVRGLFILVIGNEICNNKDQVSLLKERI